MSLISIGTVVGAPGATTFAVALALHWSRPVLLLEADTSKASSILPGYLRGQVDHSLGLTALSIAHQRNALNPDALLAQTIELADETMFVAGFRNQAAGLGATMFWSNLASTVRSLEGAGIDCIVDLGRIAPDDARTSILRASDSVLIVARPLLPDVAALNYRLPELHDIVGAVGGTDFLDLVLIDSDIDTYSAREVSNAVQTVVLGTMSHDPRSAAVYSLGAQKPQRFERSAYERTLRSTAATLEEKLRQRQDRLGFAPTTVSEATS